MFLLIDTVRLLHGHFLHCLLYSLPAQAALALMFYLLEADLHWGLVFACVCVFLLLNTLYVHAASQQLLKSTSGAIDLMSAVRWQRGYFDFFVFIALGIITLSMLAVYFIDAVDYLMTQVAEMKQLITEANRRGEATAAGSYSVLAFGSEVLSFALLAAALLFWMRICRSGVRIPAYVEGYYLRSEEALQLTRQTGIAPLACSFLFIMLITAYSDVLLERVPQEAQHWLLPLLWAGGYFLIVTAHLAMWVNMYLTHIKMAGYNMMRMVI